VFFHNTFCLINDAAKIYYFRSKTSLIEIYFSNNQNVKKHRKKAEKLLQDVIFWVKCAEKNEIVSKYLCH